MFKGTAMSLKKLQWIAVGITLSMGLARAENEGMASLQSVPAGERVANYLQAYFMKVGTVVEAKSSGGLFEGAQTYRVIVSYDPDKKDLDVAVIGMAQDPEVEQNMLGTVREILLKLNPKLQKYFGVTLQDTDLSMDYLYAKSGTVLTRFREGKYMKVALGKPTPAPEPESLNR